MARKTKASGGSRREISSRGKSPRAQDCCLTVRVEGREEDALLSFFSFDLSRRLLSSSLYVHQALFHPSQTNVHTFLSRPPSHLFSGRCPSPTSSDEPRAPEHALPAAPAPVSN